MKKSVSLDRLVRIVVSGIALSALACGLAVSRPTVNVVPTASVHARIGTLLADGTESNGGKGSGKPGGHRSSIA